VQRPGTYDLPAANNDLLSALMAAGGLTDKAATIVEIRGSPSGAAIGGDRQPASAATDPVRIDLIAASEGITPEYQIRDGSVIMVREQDPKKIQVIGLVRKPDQFEIPRDQEIRLLDAIALANGRTLELADKVHIVRNIERGSKSIVIAASVREAKRSAAANILLAPGDVVSVEETPLTFTVGTIREFVRFGFSSAIPGM
jgi:polysaccharide export outer membrane protein